MALDQLIGGELRVDEVVSEISGSHAALTSCPSSLLRRCLRSSSGTPPPLVMSTYGIGLPIFIDGQLSIQHLRSCSRIPPVVPRENVQRSFRLRQDIRTLLQDTILYPRESAFIRDSMCRSRHTMSNANARDAGKASCVAARVKGVRRDVYNGKGTHCSGTSACDTKCREARPASPSAVSSIDRSL